VPQFYKLLIKVWWFPCAEPAYLPNGESPKNVSDVTLPVFRSRTVTVVTSFRRVIVTLLSFEIAMSREPDLLAFVVYVVHALSLLFDFFAA